MKNNIDEKMYFYEQFAKHFDSKMNMYDTNRRLDIVFNELLPDTLKGKVLLDAGCGTGWFSKEAYMRGAQVISMDLGQNLLDQVAKKCDSKRIVGSVLDIPFGDNYFDIVISSDVIEHTPDPQKAIREMKRVLKKNGVLALTVPNKIWYPAIFIANKFKLRPYEGYENWVGWFELQQWFKEIGLSVAEIKGIHLFPFVLPFTHRLLRVLDKFGHVVGPVMLNICIKAIKN